MYKPRDPPFQQEDKSIAQSCTHMPNKDCRQMCIPLAPVEPQHRKPLQMREEEEASLLMAALQGSGFSAALVVMLQEEEVNFHEEISLPMARRVVQQAVQELQVMVQEALQSLMSITEPTACGHITLTPAHGAQPIGLLASRSLKNWQMPPGMARWPRTKSGAS